MTHSPARIIEELLIALGVGTDPESPTLGEWPVFFANEPGSPDQAITVYDTAGIDAGRSMLTGEPYTFHGFQVRVRSSTPASGWAKGDAVRTVLASGFYDRVVTVDGTRYKVHCASRIGNVLALGKETPTSKRSLFTVNAVAAIRQLD